MIESPMSLYFLIDPRRHVMFSRHAFLVVFNAYWLQLLLNGVEQCCTLLQPLLHSVRYKCILLQPYNNAVLGCLLFPFQDPGTEDFTDDTIEGRTMMQYDRSLFLSFVFLLSVAQQISSQKKITKNVRIPIQRSLILTLRVPAISAYTLFISLFSVVTVLALRRDANYPLPNVFQT